jgi:hypothetical protein
MDVTNLIREYVTLRNKSKSEVISPEQSERMELLKKALMMAEKKLSTQQEQTGSGSVRIRFHDGDSMREIRHDQLTEPILEVELNAGVTEGFKIFVVDREKGPASAIRARILGRSEKGPRWYRIDLGKEVMHL